MSTRLAVFGLCCAILAFYTGPVLAQSSGDGDEQDYSGSGGGVTGTGVYYNPGGSGEGPSGSGYGSGYGPSGSGDYGPSGSGYYGGSGSGDYDGSGWTPDPVYYGLDPNGSCSNSPCQNNAGCCEAPEGGWHCYCLLGYEEPDCSYFNDPCSSVSGENPCMNGGTCYYDPASSQAACVCPTGFAGVVCEFSAPTDCNSDECQNGGTCLVDSYGFAMCTCPDGFSGSVCEFALGECEEDTCENGHCVEWICAGYYACNCDEGFSGTFCDEEDYQPSGSGDYGSGGGMTGTGVYYNPGGSGDGPSGSGYGSGYGPSGSGDYGPSGSGDYGPSGSGDYGPSGSGDYGPSGSGDYGPSGSGDYGPSGSGDYGPSGSGDYGPSAMYYGLDPNGTCSDSPCQNSVGCCEAPEGGWYCACLLGYAEPDCSYFNNDPCNSGHNPCMNGGDCYFDSYSNQAYCHCQPGFTGPACEFSAPTDCSSDECQNGGTCTMESYGDAWCACPDGFSGPVCEFAIGECEEDICVHGDCVEWICAGYYACNCDEGYSGTYCDVQHNETDGCSSSPCQNGASCCEDPEGGWYCDCPLGYEGPDCATFNDPCAGENPCMHGGTCQFDSTMPDYAYCHCPHGFTGQVCETTVPTDCTLDECQNGAACEMDSWGGGDVWCVCPDGFTGPYCEFLFGDCQEDSCEQGNCHPVGCEGYHTCECEEGYSGTFCEISESGDYGPSGSGDYGPSGSGDYGPSGSGDYGPSGSGDYGPSGSGDYGPSGSGDYGPSGSGYGSGDYGPSGSGDYGPSGSGDYGPSAMYYGLDPNGTCSDSPCQNSVGCCEAPEGGWYCACMLGYEEPDCSYLNNDPCNSASGENPCMNGGDCYFDSYNNQASCHCQPGFTGPMCEFSAPTDCNSDECQNGGTCTMESYGYAWCACPEGFSGPVCEFAIGECEEDICVHGDCVEWICAGYYACNCDEGYSGTYCDVQHNETDGCSSSPCQNGASCCEDPEGGWYCDCPLGYEQPDCATFNDPCAGENPCMHGGTCQFDSTMPDYAYCHCPHGFTGKVCETTVPTDCTLDECQNGAACEMDSWGGGDVWCVCPDGFTGPYCEFLFGDCQEDSCEQGNCHPVGCEGYHTCECEEGYSGTFCEVHDDSHYNDTDGCSSSPCQNGASCCGDPEGGWYCDCPLGYEEPDCATFNDPCAGENPCMQGGTCQFDSTMPDYAYCQCPHGFTGQVCETTVPTDCTLGECQNGATCEMDSWGGGDVWCVCPDGFTGPYCEFLFGDCQEDSCEQGDCHPVGCEGYHTCECEEGYSGTFCEISGSGDYGPSGSGDYGPSGSGYGSGYGPSGTGDYGPSGSGYGSGYGPSGSGDYGPSGSGYGSGYGPSGSGDYGPSGSGDYGPSGSGYGSGYGPSGSGDYGPSGSGYGSGYGPSGSGDYGPSGSGDYGPSAMYYGLDPNGTCSDSPCQNSVGCCEAPEGGWYCACMLGYEEPDCSYLNNDPCNSASGENPCMNGGDCYFDSYSNQASCHCQPGFTGPMCEFSAPTDCNSDECQNGGTCTMESYGYAWCACPEGFSGPVCEFALGECEEDICVHGDCVEWLCAGYYACNCDEGYSGTYCDVQHNETDGCSSSPCQNGASCCEDPEGGWYCDCPLGYEGPDCATFNDPCAGENPCMHGGTCQFDSTMPDYAYCQCPHGFTGKVCETTVPTDCTLDECQNGAPCEMDSWGGGDVWCVCPDGFTGPYCEFLFGDCQEDSCEQGNCHPLGCEGYHTCECEEGYSGSFCEISGSGDYRTSGSGDYGPSGSGDYEPSGYGDYGPSGSGDYEPSGSGDYGPSGSGDFGPSGSGDYGPSGSGDYGPSGSGDYGPSGSGDYGPSGSSDYGPSGSGDYGPSGSGDEGPNGSGDEGPSGSGDEGRSGSGDEGPSGSGDYGPSGSGDDGPSGSGDYGPSGSGDDGPSGSGDYGPSGSGDDGPSGSGDDGPSGSGDYGPSGSGDDGPSGSGDEGPNGSGDEGSSGSGDEGLSGSGDEGPNGSGDEEPSGSGDDGPYTSSEGPEPYTPSEGPEPYTPSEGPEPYYTSESPGPYHTSDGPNPTESPGPNPTEGPVPASTEAPGPNPLEDSNLYPFGPEAGDQEYEDLLNSGEGHYWGECLEQGINDEGFPFFGKRHYKLYVSVCDNGMISFETPWAPWIPYLFGTRRTYNNIAMTAPFWAMSDASSLSQDRQGTQHSHIYFHSYAEGDGQANTEEILNRAGDDANDYDSSLPDFRPTWALVVTWVDLPPYIGCSCYRGWGCEDCDLSDVQTNTFQAVLMTNALHSFSKVIYPEGGLNWVYPGFSDEYYQYFTDVSGLPWPVAGFSAGDEGQNVVNLPTYSGTQRMHLLDEVEGNTGYTGQWMVRMEDSDGTMDARLECLSWYRNQADPADVQATLSVLPPDCPCTEWQLWFDGAFQIDWSSSWWDICAYSAFPTADGLVQKCCYEDGALKTGGPDGGYVIQNREDDDWAYTKCCVESVGTCDLFYEKRPSANCSQYLPPIWSWTWGDPHITTLDGKRYTFNGKGEYIMADVDNGQYQVQARTAFPEGTTTATAFSAMVIQKNGGVPIQVNVASDSETGMNLYIDGALQDMTVYGNVSTAIAQESNVLVSRPSASEFKVYYSTGVSATAQVEQGMMSIVFSAPVSFMGKTKGLLGVWDGDQANDFMMHDGTVLSTNSTERQIFDFGRSWQVTAGAGDKASLFHYDAGQGVDTYQDDTFVPTFGDEAGTPDPVLQQQAEDQCGGNQECVYDVLQTGSVAVGAASLHQSSTIEDGSQKTSNYPPTVTGPTVLYAVYQETLEFSLTAEDRNGDSVSFSVSSPSTLAASVLSASGNTATFSWRVDREESFNLKILVTDAGGASALYWPTVYLCSCENDGSCATSGGAHSSSNNTR
ncbi:uncharacterized protein [Branchiostoma lanceolatum]|uniref:uncharacterized protein n=1 Tax=Branchiostoma lanceolatum TaxID=7740 RepID=UPI00345483FF